MKILILHKALIIGGIEKVLITYLKLLSKLNYDIDLHLTYDLKNNNIDFKEIPRKTKTTFSLNQMEFLTLEESRKNRKKSIFHRVYYEIQRRIQKEKYCHHIKKILSKNHYDIIIDFSFCSDILVKRDILRKFSSAKLIKWSHSQTPEKDRAKMAKIYSYFDKIIAISSEMKLDLIKHLHLSENRVSLIYNPIDIQNIIQKSLFPITENIISDYFLTVSRLVNGKGLFELIDIYNILKINGLKNKLYIIGDGELREKLEEKIVSMSLEKDCILLGRKDNPYPYFKNAKLFLFTSESEGLPTVLLESMALSIPVISMNCPTGPKEILGENNEHGKLVPLHDKKKFIQDIHTLLSDGESYRSYSIRSFNRANNFSCKQAMDNIEILFTQLIKDKNHDQK